jgi:hypothetical protein
VTILAEQSARHAGYLDPSYLQTLPKVRRMKFCELASWRLRRALEPKAPRESTNSLLPWLNVAEYVRNKLVRSIMTQSGFWKWVTPISVCSL